MYKIKNKLSVSEENILREYTNDNYELVNEINGNCYVLTVGGRLTYNQCFDKSENDFLKKQLYESVKPIKIIKIYSYYLFELEGELGIWYRGRLDANGNYEVESYNESLEEAINSL